MIADFVALTIRFTHGFFHVKRSDAFVLLPLTIVLHFHSHFLGKTHQNQAMWRESSSRQNVNITLCAL